MGRFFVESITGRGIRYNLDSEWCLLRNGWCSINPAMVQEARLLLTRQPAGLLHFCCIFWVRFVCQLRVSALCQAECIPNSIQQETVHWGRHTRLQQVLACSKHTPECGLPSASYILRTLVHAAGISATEDKG